MNTALSQTSTFFVLVFGCAFAQAQVPFELVTIEAAETGPAKPYGKAVGDLSGDGQPDLFVSSAAGGGMHWYIYPTWKKQTIRSNGSWSEDCQIADIDGDGDLDLINGNSEGLFWYENSLKSTETPGTSTTKRWADHRIGSDGTNIHDLEIADFNGDGRLDVAVRYEKEFRRSVAIFIQEASGTWLEVTQTNVSHRKGEGLALGDLDGDRDVDIALGNIWLENLGKGARWSEHPYAVAMPEQVIIAVADIDGNGALDIVAAPQSSQSGSFAWYSGSRDLDQVWGEHVILQNVTRMHGLGVADFNGDGHLDIHTSIRHDRRGTDDNVSIWISGGEQRTRFTEQILSVTGSHFSKIGDIDSDGDIDIFGANWSGSGSLHADIQLWRNQTQ